MYPELYGVDVEFGTGFCDGGWYVYDWVNGARGCGCAWAVNVAVALALAVDDGIEGLTTSPAFGGGGTGDDVPGAVGSGIPPGCGGGGDWVDIVVVAGRGAVGVAVRVFGAALPVGPGRLGAAPGCAVAYIGEYEGAVAVAEVFGGCDGVIVVDSIVVAGSGWEVVVCVPCSFSSLFELRGAEV